MPVRACVIAAARVIPGRLRRVHVEFSRMYDLDPCSFQSIFDPSHSCGAMEYVRKASRSGRLDGLDLVGQLTPLATLRSVGYKPYRQQITQQYRRLGALPGVDYGKTSEQPASKTANDMHASPV